MEQMKNQWYMGMPKLHLTRLFAKIMALGWYEYEQAKEDLAMPERIEHDKRLLDFYEQRVRDGRKETHRLKGGA